PENVVEALVGEAFNRLDTNAQKVMQALAVYNRPVTPAAVDYLLAPHIPAMDSAPILQRLANMHFARKESGRFYLHPVDREFAFGLIPQGETRDWRLEISDSDESQETDDQSPISNYQLPFTQHDLTLRAADYFAAARKPRAEWKKLEDLSAQLAEFDLRCAAGDYDTAASVLLEIDFDCLFQWGHHHLMIELHMKSLEEIQDKTLAMLCNGRLGLACRAIGFIHEFIRYEEKALKTAQEAKDQNNEAAWLGNLGLAYADLGDVHKAIEFNEKALVIDREIDDLNGQSLRLGNLGGMNFSLGNANKAYDYFEKALSIASEIGARHQEIYMLISAGDVQSFLAKNQKAKECYLQAIKIADEISLPYAQLGSRCGLAEVYLHQNDLVNARATIEAALQCNVLENNYNATILHGIIALRQGDVVTARGAFVRAIGQADEILSKTAEYYTALDAKGLASCGLALCRDDLHGHPGAGIGAGIGASPILTDAIDTFRKARKIAPHAGIVKATLRLFDELTKCEGGEMLKDVRKAAEGAEDP
ncbi:tetratricopeptide repeat protein, partial [Chloroflexi bacterium CFX6]|nr:tetratricopeptide repeat protein [Chloroflexi bacterium CFX6]